MARFSVTERTNWSQHSEAGKGRKVNARASLAARAPAALVGRRGAEICVRAVHIPCSDCEGYLVTPELSPQTSLHWSPIPKARPELTNPFGFRRPSQDNGTDTHSTIGKPRVPNAAGSSLSLSPGCPQSTSGAEAEQRCCFGAHRNEGLAHLGAAQAATTRGATELNSSGAEQETWMLQEAQTR